MNSENHIPVVVIACRVFEGLLERYLPPDLADEVSYLDYGLHTFPKKLRQNLQESIDRLPEPSLVVLGYGLCGNGLDGIQAGPHTLLVPRTDDCIAILLGSYANYRKEFDAIPGTYYLTKGWLEAGSNPLQEYEKYRQQYGEESASWVMDQQYRHYKRLAFVAHDQTDLDAYRSQAKTVAKYCARWGMNYVELLGSDAYVRQLVAVARTLEQAGQEFVIVTPGGMLRQRAFLREA